ncbi:F-box domain protein [Favolaschia claudopus]|uniref:F-box domain protein n=1 Tax=Favolaschia claudopus TaxID=2862362 RepID=A0AAW0DCR9_9AGAR
MSWSDHLRKAKDHLKSSRLDASLKEINEALRVGGDREYTVYDSRAAIYERQGKAKSALQDVKTVINLAPNHWQGYARASRLFLTVRKLDEAVAMADMALSRLNTNDTMRRQKLQDLKDEVEQQRRRQTNQFGKLPVEIITAIFELAVSSDWSRVLIVWAVSKHWHHIALNTPSLWSTLVLTRRHPARHARKWIKRSKGRIREISFRSTLPRSKVKLDGMLWSHLRVCKLDNHDIAEYVGGKSKLTRLSELSELHVKDTTLDCDPLLSASGSGLRRLTLDGPRFTWETIAASHGHLTSLEIRTSSTPPDLELLMCILESNTMLEQLVLGFDTGGPLSTSLPSPLTLPNLRSLHLSSTPWIYFFGVLVPSLETLHLTRIRRLELLPLIVQNPRLTSLSLNGCLVSSEDVIKLLRPSLTLSSLELTRVGQASNAVLAALVNPTPGVETTLCPALEYLDVSYCPDLTTASVTKLLDFRNPQTDVEVSSQPADATQSTVLARIRTVRVDGCPQIQANFIPWFETRVESFSCVYMSKREASWKR